MKTKILTMAVFFAILTLSLSGQVMAQQPGVLEVVGMVDAQQEAQNVTLVSQIGGNTRAVAVLGN